MLKIQTPAQVSDLERMIAALNSLLDETDCPESIKTQLDIAAEEIFVNISSYAYAPETGDVTVTFNIDNETDVLTMTFEDTGKPYDPLKKPDPDVTLSLDDRPIGGLGIFMVKKSMDDIRYEYRDGKNILTVVKSLAGK